MTLRRAVFIWMVAAACLIVAPIASAQSDAEAPSLDELRQQIQRLDRELAAERELQKQLEQNHDRELDTLRHRRAERAKQALDTQVQLEQTRRRAAQLDSELAPLREQAEAMDRAAEQVRVTAAATAERVRIGLDELPATEDTAAALTEAVAALREPDGLNPEALRAITGRLNLAHQRATRITVRPTTLHTADGLDHPVRLLSIGHVRFAYVTGDGGHVGLALSAPSEASGYRWSESIPADAADQVRRAVEAVESDGSDLVEAPMDVTGRLGPDTLTASPSLTERFGAGGPVMIPIALAAVLALLLILERLFVLYGLNRGGGRLAQRVAIECQAMRYDQARSLCGRAGGAVGRVLGACLGRRDRGQRAMEDSIQEQLLQELPRLGRFMGGIAILAAVAPLLGLLGTVTGIIQTFGVIRAFGNANPSLMAGGISEALLTTAAGLIIAIPILIAHSLLRGRADRILADAERHAASLLTLLVHDQPPEADPEADDD